MFHLLLEITYKCLLVFFFAFSLFPVEKGTWHFTLLIKTLNTRSFGQIARRVFYLICLLLEVFFLQGLLVRWFCWLWFDWIWETYKIYFWNFFHHRSINYRPPVDSNILGKVYWLVSTIRFPCKHLLTVK